MKATPPADRPANDAQAKRAPAKYAGSDDRPGMESARKIGWRRWLLQEWGLLLLAGVLAVILWEVTSTRVIRELRITDVRVELVVREQDRERVGAVLDTRDATVTLAMTCSERERYAILAALTETGGGTPVLRLRVNPKVDSERRRFNLQRDAWLWPVPNAAEIELAAEVPVGWVYSIEGMQQVHIEKPATIPDAEGLALLGYEILRTDPETEPPVDIRLDHAFMEFLAPRAIFTNGEGGLSMAPEPIDLRALIAGEAPPLGKPQSFTLTFNTWRSDDPYRSRLPLKKITATLTLIRPETANFTNRLEVLLHPDLGWEPATSPDNINTTVVPFEFTGTLRGPKQILDEIKADLSGWMWQMWVSKPAKDWPRGTTDMEDGRKDEVRKNVPARIDWVPLRADWKGKGVRFVPGKGSVEDGFTVKVFLRAKK